MKLTNIHILSRLRIRGVILLPLPPHFSNGGCCVRKEKNVACNEGKLIMELMTELSVESIYIYEWSTWSHVWGPVKFNNKTHFGDIHGELLNQQ
jgi:hypothetical protein